MTQVIVIKDCDDCFTTVKERYWGPRPGDRLKAGEVLNVLNENEYKIDYRSHGGSVNNVPKSHTAPYPAKEVVGGTYRVAGQDCEFTAKSFYDCVAGTRCAKDKSDNVWNMTKCYLTKEPTQEVVGGTYKVIANSMGWKNPQKSNDLFVAGDTLVAINFCDPDGSNATAKKGRCVRHTNDSWHSAFPLCDLELVAKPPLQEIVGATYRVLSNKLGRYKEGKSMNGLLNTGDLLVALSFGKNIDGHYGLQHTPGAFAFPLDELEFVSMPKPKAKEVLGATYKVISNNRRASKRGPTGQVVGPLRPGDLITAYKFESDTEGVYGVRHSNANFCLPLEEVEFVKDPVLPETIIGATYKIISTKDSFGCDIYTAGVEIVATGFSDGKTTFAGSPAIPTFLLELVKPKQVYGGAYQVLKASGELKVGETITAYGFRADGRIHYGECGTQLRLEYVKLISEPPKVDEVVGATYKIISNPIARLNPQGNKKWKPGDTVVAREFKVDETGVYGLYHTPVYHCIPMCCLELVKGLVEHQTKEVIGATYRAIRDIPNRCNGSIPGAPIFKAGMEIVATGFEDSKRPPLAGRAVLYKTGSWSVLLSDLELVKEPGAAIAAKEVVGGTYKVRSNKRRSATRKNGEHYIIQSGDTIVALRFEKDHTGVYGLRHTDHYFCIPLEELELISEIGVVETTPIQKIPEVVGGTYRFIKDSKNNYNPAKYLSGAQEEDRYFKKGDSVTAIKFVGGYLVHNSGYRDIPLADLEFVSTPTPNAGDTPATKTPEIIGGTYRFIKDSTKNYKPATSGNPKPSKSHEFFKKGDTVTAIEFTRRGLIHNTNFDGIPLSDLEYMGASEPTPTPEVVGATYKVTKDTFTPNPNKKHKHGDFEYFQKGDTVVAAGFSNSYMFHDMNRMGIPMTHLEYISGPVAASDQPKVTTEAPVSNVPQSTSAETRSDNPPFEVGDWVRFTDIHCGFPVPDNVRRRTLMRRKARVGDVTQLVATRKTNGIWEGGYRHKKDKETQYVKLNRFEAAEPPKPFPLKKISFGLIATALSGISAYQIHKEFDMRQIIESIGTDPSVHEAIVRVIQAISVFVMASMGWVGVNRVANGWAKVQDRRRRLRQEETSTLAAAIAEAVNNNKPKV